MVGLGEFLQIVISWIGGSWKRCVIPCYKSLRITSASLGSFLSQLLKIASRRRAQAAIARANRTGWPL